MTYLPVIINSIVHNLEINTQNHKSKYSPKKQKINYKIVKSKFGALQYLDNV